MGRLAAAVDIDSGSGSAVATLGRRQGSSVAAVETVSLSADCHCSQPGSGTAGKLNRQRASASGGWRLKEAHLYGCTR